MVTNAASARARVRLILDRANSPWLTNTEIDAFIEMSINEYLRERVDFFGSNQKIRDDFGKFVKTAIYSNEPYDAADDLTSVLKRQFVNYNESSAYENDDSIESSYPGASLATTQQAGTGCDINSIFCGTVLYIKVVNTSTGVVYDCKIVSIDDAIVSSKNPFHTPVANDLYHAVRVEDIYWIRPGLTGTSHAVEITYISNLVENRIGWLPLHGREEVCQIAARKIMGTVADERMPVAASEIKQLEGK